MRIETLPSPGLLANGIRLRTEAAKAISGVEVLATFTAGKSTAAKPLADFFTACAAALASFVDDVVSTFTARSVAATSPTVIRLRASEGLDSKFVPAPAAFTLAGAGLGGKTITKVVVDGPDVLLTVSAPFTAGQVVTVAYTQPGSTSNLRDISGNLLATFTAAAIVNGVA